MGPMISSKHSSLAAGTPTGSPSAPSTSVVAPAIEAGSAFEEPSELNRLATGLSSAADAAAAAGIPLEEFMRQAWSAFVDARPGLREHLADAQLMQQIQELRGRGKVGEA